MKRTTVLLLAVATAAGIVLTGPTATAGPETRLPELSETERLTDRRALVVGDRAYAMGDETGRYPATGWHIRGEMGGFWSQPVKLLDGLWLGIDGQWLGEQIPAARYTKGFGYQRFDYATTGLRAQRVEFVPEGTRATLVGLTVRSDRAREVTLSMDAHSELMPSYPWGWTKPSAAIDTQDTGAFTDNALLFRDNGNAHDYAAIAGSSSVPVSHLLGPGHRGPQEPAVICPAEGAAPQRCDDSAFGKGTGGRLDYRLALLAGKDTTVWFAVAGSDNGAADARATFDHALRDPERLLRETMRARADVGRNTTVDLPGDRLLQRSVEWSKQNLADSIQEARDLRVRDVDEGRAYPPAKGTVAKARWLAAGFPDYPWIFATDGEYTAYAAVAAGQFDIVKDHLRALREVSDLLNDGSGKVVHEIVPTGDVYFGSNSDAGNTDETVKFPSTVALLWRWTGDNAFRDEMYDFAVRNLRYVERTLDTDGDGWLEGLGNVERSGMGQEKLDSTVYYIRGLRDLADLATSKGDTTTARWATAKATDLESRFESQWWTGGDARAYAESIDDPMNPANDNAPVFQRHWTGVTPMEAEIVHPDGRVGPLAANGATALLQREKPCYTGEFGLFHTGSGPTSTPGGNKGPSCDSVVSTVGGERATFSLNTAVMAVAEGNYGRLGPDQQGVHTRGNARIQLDPSVWETPGAMPEIAPSPDFTANIDRPFYDRSMMLQAWGAYGILWPVVHQQLGVSPDLGRARLSVVPQVPPGQPRITGRDIQVGAGAVDVTAEVTGRTYRSQVRLHGSPPELTIGAVLPADATVARVSVNGKATEYAAVRTARGLEIRVQALGRSADLEVRVR
ncbi:MAG: glycogen debranching protein [Actinomycetota bacterium]|nr:glycogen debranching protein [Actinomycetota bacterium]